jgi:hypothetical protein
MFILYGDVDTAEPNEEILTYDVPDDALERVAAASNGGVTIGNCTHWYYCGWPM